MTSWIMVLLLANVWTITPWDFPDKDKCEAAYADVAKEFLKEQLQPPQHSCVEQFRIDYSK